MAQILRCALHPAIWCAAVARSFHIAAQVDAVEQQGPGPDSKKQAAMLNEQLTQKLLKLDTLEVNGEARTQRKAYIVRANELCDRLEHVRSGRL